MHLLVIAVFVVSSTRADGRPPHAEHLPAGQINLTELPRTNVLQLGWACSLH